MARGWESKAVESQQDQAAQQAVRGPDLSPDERDRIARRTGLELALAQTQAEIGAACRPPHREMLRMKLDAIRSQLASLS